MGGLTRTLVLALFLCGTGGCALTERRTPPPWDAFDIVQYPGGAVPATLGYYAAAAAWRLPGLALGAFPPDPVGTFLDDGIGHGLGTMTGFVLGAPFHLVSLPSRWLAGEPDPVPEVDADATN